MPIFEYLCADCGKEFEAIVNSSSDPQCPACSSHKLEQQLSTFAVATKGSAVAARPRPTGGCGSCGDPRGPGACSMD